MKPDFPLRIMGSFSYRRLAGMANLIMPEFLTTTCDISSEIGSTIFHMMTSKICSISSKIDILTAYIGYQTTDIQDSVLVFSSFSADPIEPYKNYISNTLIKTFLIPLEMVILLKYTLLGRSIKHGSGHRHRHRHRR